MHGLIFFFLIGCQITVQIDRTFKTEEVYDCTADSFTPRPTIVPFCPILGDPLGKINLGTPSQQDATGLFKFPKEILALIVCPALMETCRLGYQLCSPFFTWIDVHSLWYVQTSPSSPRNPESLQLHLPLPSCDSLSCPFFKIQTLDRIINFCDFVILFCIFFSGFSPKPTTPLSSSQPYLDIFTPPHLSMLPHPDPPVNFFTFTNFFRVVRELMEIMLIINIEIGKMDQQLLDLFFVQMENGKVELNLRGEITPSKIITNQVSQNLPATLASSHDPMINSFSASMWTTHQVTSELR